MIFFYRASNTSFWPKNWSAKVSYLLTKSWSVKGGYEWIFTWKRTAQKPKYKSWLDAQLQFWCATKFYWRWLRWGEFLSFTRGGFPYLWLFNFNYKNWGTDGGGCRCLQTLTCDSVGIRRHQNQGQIRNYIACGQSVERRWCSQRKFWKNWYGAWRFVNFIELFYWKKCREIRVDTNRGFKEIFTDFSRWLDWIFAPRWLLYQCLRCQESKTD